MGISSTVDLMAGNLLQAGVDGTWRSMTYNEGVKHAEKNPGDFWFIWISVSEKLLFLSGVLSTEQQPSLFGANGLIMYTYIIGVKIRGFLGDYCIRTRCPTIKTRPVKLYSTYNLFTVLFVVRFVYLPWRMGRGVYYQVSHLIKDLVLPC